MTDRGPIVILGGGLSGMAAAYTLAEAGCRDVTVVERGPELGGLAGTFEMDEHFYPLGYHHVLHRDGALLWFLDRIGALPRVRWRKIRMLFRVGGRLYDLAHPLDFLRFPMSLTDKARFVRLMLKSFRKTDWSDWHQRSAADLIDGWAGPGVREAIFEPLTRLKFDAPAAEVSGAWLGARLHFREGSAPLGYIPGSNWTRDLCDGVTRLMLDAGVRVRTGATVTGLSTGKDRITEVTLEGGERLPAELVVSTIPTEVYCALRPDDVTSRLGSIRYTAMLSVICAARQQIRPEFYWMNLASLDCNACGIFLLDALNPTIGAPGDTTVNFVTHLRSREAPLFGQSDEQILEAYLEDFRKIFGFELEPFWTRINRIPMYSPVFLRGYENPPAQSETWRNVWFAGNYRTFPSVASTGTALASGLETAAAILEDRGGATGLPDAVRRFRLRSMPRA